MRTQTSITKKNGRGMKEHPVALSSLHELAVGRVQIVQSKISILKHQKKKWQEVRRCEQTNSNCTYKSFVKALGETSAAKAWKYARAIKVTKEDGTEVTALDRANLAKDLIDLKKEYKCLNKALQQQLPSSHRQKISDKLPRYDPAVYDDCADWLEIIENMLYADGVSPQDFHRGLLKAANKTVSTWYKARRKEGFNLKDWDLLKDAFIDRFSDADLLETRFLALKNFAPNTDLTLKENIMEIEHLAERAQIPDSDILIVKTTVDALLSTAERNTIAAVQGPRETYRDYLLIVTNTLKDRKMASLSKFYCKVCKGVGHTSVQCPSNGGGLSRALGNKRTATDLYEGIKPAEKPTIVTPATPAARSRVCFQCGDSNHRYKDCPKIPAEVKARMASIDDHCIDAEEDEEESYQRAEF